MVKEKILNVLLLLSSVFVLTACGQDTSADSKLRDYFVIETTETALVTPELDSDWHLLGTHFLNGEAIQIWGQNIRNEQLQGFWDVYVYHEDGSSEFKFGGVRNYYRSDWYMDEGGEFYIAMGNELVKLDSDGKEVFNRTFDRTFKTMYKDEKGNWLVMGETAGGVLVTSQLDEETGELADVESIAVEDKEIIYYLAKQADGTYMMDKNGVWKLNSKGAAKETVISFVESAYTLEMAPENFKITEDGAVELLLNGKKVTLTRKNMADTRIILTVCSWENFSNVRKALNQFNQENDTYYVVWEAPEEPAKLTGLKERVGIEFATGGGPDLMFVSGLIDNDILWDYAEKGAFVELNSYMEQSSVTEENYFPVTFTGLTVGEDIYGVSLFAALSGYWISSEVLGSNMSPAMGEFVDALLDYEGTAFLSGMKAENLPHMFFNASESLHGAVNWEAGTCNFEKNELFKKILQVCKRYGNDRKNDYPELTGALFGKLYGDTMEKNEFVQEKIPVWNFFDGGNYPGVENLYTIVMNSNTPCPEGAWEVLEYLLSDEVQDTIGGGTSSLFPVKRSSFDALLEREMEESSIVGTIREDGILMVFAKAGLEGYKNSYAAWDERENYRAKYDITEDKARILRQRMETARIMPLRNRQILSIVREEAAAYFAEQKSLDEVCALIQNRVQLYLDEKN